jgi:hypothetical protein
LQAAAMLRIVLWAACNVIEPQVAAAGTLCAIHPKHYLKNIDRKSIIG